MGRQAIYRPFSWAEWQAWRDVVIGLEADVRERAIHVGFAFGPHAEDRGKRIERDLRAYREYISKLAFNRIADAAQYEMIWDGEHSAV